MLNSNHFSWKPLNFKQRIGAPGYFGRTDGCIFCSESPQEMQCAHVSMRTQNWYEEILWFVSFNTSASLFKFFLKLLHLWELEALWRKSCKNLQRTLHKRTEKYSGYDVLRHHVGSTRMAKPSHSNIFLHNTLHTNWIQKHQIFKRITGRTWRDISTRCRRACKPVTHLQSGELPTSVQSDTEHGKHRHLQPDQPAHHGCQATLQPPALLHFR